jgi:hypothetical protein
MRAVALRHEFVEYLPTTLEGGTLYVSLPYATAAHRCACGCGYEVVTPLSPTDWQILFDGLSISLTPSIGNWNFPCRSHYWISHNKIQWARQWTRQEIDAGRAHDRYAKEQCFDDATVAPGWRVPAAKSRWRRIRDQLFGPRGL